MRVGVYGLGNILMGDDALGPYVAEVLAATYTMPPEVTVADLGTPGLDLAPYLAGVDALVLVDTVRATGAPGDIREYRLPDILRHPPQPRLSPHDPGVKESLLLASALGQGPSDVLLIGVIPQGTATGIGLSRPVWQAVPIVVALVIAELHRLGLAVGVRERFEVPHIWWEQPAAAS
jgi:hydrogenase maturation protease